MSFRASIGFAAFVCFLATAGMWTSAQVGSRSPFNRGEPLGLVAPTVIAGSDLGFRVESTKDGIAVGKIVVRIDGHWVDAQVGTNGLIAAAAR